jgi:hypothetical protein
MWDRTNGEQWICDGGSGRPKASQVKENPIMCRRIERERGTARVEERQRRTTDASLSPAEAGKFGGRGGSNAK